MMARLYNNGRQLLICLVGILAIDSIMGATQDQCLQTFREATANATNNSWVYCPQVEKYGKCLIQVPELSSKSWLVDHVFIMISSVDRISECSAYLPRPIRQWVVDVLPGNRIWGISGTVTDHQFKMYHHCYDMNVRDCKDIEDEMVCRLRALDLEYMLPNNVHYSEVSYILTARTKSIGSSCYFDLREILKRAQANSSSKNYGSIMTVLSLILSVAMFHW